MLKLIAEFFRLMWDIDRWLGLLIILLMVISVGGLAFIIGYVIYSATLAHYQSEIGYVQKMNVIHTKNTSYAITVNGLDYPVDYEQYELLYIGEKVKVTYKGMITENLEYQP